MAVLQNIVVCPHCDNAFEHNKINGIALVELASDIEARKRTCLKLTLDTIDSEVRAGKLDAAEFQKLRKIILDNVNDMVRDVHTYIGFGLTVE